MQCRHILLPLLFLAVLDHRSRADELARGVVYHDTNDNGQYDPADTMIYANVFNGSARTKTEIRLGDQGTWTTMDRTEEIDPGYQSVFDCEQEI